MFKNMMQLCFLQFLFIFKNNKFINVKLNGNALNGDIFMTIGPSMISALNERTQSVAHADSILSSLFLVKTTN